MDTTDWRTQLQPDSRQRIIDKIMVTLKRHLPVSSPDGLADLRNIATRFEEKVYTAGTSQSDYIRKIDMKMIVMESKSQTTGKRRKANTIQSNSAGSAQNPPDSGQSQIPLSNKFEAWQQLLSQNVENTIANTGVQSSSNLPSALPSVTSLTHTSTANAAGQSTNMQSVIEQNFVRNSVSQGLPSNIFSNSQYLNQHHQILSSSIDSTTQTGQDAIDWSWRIALRPDSRQKQLNRILETLKNCFPICGSVGLVELNKIAELFEEEIYTAAKSHLDYLQKVYLKILKMETRFQTAEMDDDEIMDTSDWRTQLQPDSRQRIINKIVEKSMKFLPVSDPEGLAEVQMIASRFEEKIYTAATNQSDYLWKISMKMLTMETKYQTTSMANTIPSTSAGSTQNPPKPVYYVHENEQFMDCNNWRPIKAEPDMDTTDWRTQLQPDSRQRVVNKIMETLKRHLPMSGPEGLVELNKMAVGFEDEIFGAATSQSDYLRKISLKMLAMETKVQTSTMVNTLPSNSAVIAQNPLQPAYYVREDEQFMDCNNWRPTQAEPNMDTTDWRTQLQPDSRQRVVHKIVETLKRHKHLQNCGLEGLNELMKIAVRCENRIYTGATSQSDYLRKITLKLLTFEKYHGTAQNPPNSGLMHAEQWPEVTSLLQKLELDD